MHGKGAVTIRIPGAGETALHSGASESITAFTARFPGTGSARPSVTPAEITAEITAGITAEAPTPLEEIAPATPSARDLLAPAVERLIALRMTARTEKRFADADAIRDAIEALGVELSDQADGVSWRVRA